MERMPFGKHKGQLFREIPTDYLLWVVTIADLPLLHTVIEELEERGLNTDGFYQRNEQWRDHEEKTRRDREERERHSQRRNPSPLTAEIQPWAVQIVNRGYRSLAAEHHPDMGGATQDMQRLNAAVEALRHWMEPK